MIASAQFTIISLCDVVTSDTPPQSATTTIKVALVSTSALDTDRVLPVLLPLVPQEVSTTPSLLYFVQV